MSRVYVGRLPSRCSERDIEKFFKGYGGIRDIVLKNGYGFVEFENGKDADDAVYDLRGREIHGERILVEHARLPSGARGGGRPMHRDNGRRFGPPTRTEFRVIVENLSSRVIWQDLKDLMRKVGEVAYADAHKSAKNEGIVEFLNFSDMKAAIERFDGYVLYERRLKVREDKPRRRSRSDSRDRSVSRRESRKSHSRDSYNRDRSHSRSLGRHKERASPTRSLSRHRSRSVASRNSKLSARSRSNSISRRSDRSISGRRNIRSNESNGNTNMDKEYVTRTFSRSRSRSKSHSRTSRSRSRSQRSFSSNQRHSGNEMNNRVDHADIEED